MKSAAAYSWHSCMTCTMQKACISSSAFWMAASIIDHNLFPDRPALAYNRLIFQSRVVQLIDIEINNKFITFFN